MCSISTKQHLSIISSQERGTEKSEIHFIDQQMLTGFNTSLYQKKARTKTGLFHVLFEPVVWTAERQR